MSNLKSKFAMLLVLVFGFGIFASGCGLIQKTPEAIARQKVAKVGEEYITRAELDEMFNPAVEQMKAQYGATIFEGDQGKETLAAQKKAMLDEMVNQKIFEQKARELKLFKDDNEINDEVKKNVDELIKAYNTEEELNKKLEEAKITRDLLNKILRGQVISEKVVDSMLKDVTVTDEAIKKYYDENKNSYTEKPNTMEVSHILLNTEEEAKAVKAQLDKGADFAALAKEKSNDPGSKESGGSLGELKYSDLNAKYDPDFVKGAMALKEGQISDPVKSSLGYGYHIIKVTKKNEYPVLSFDKAKDAIKDQLLYTEKEKKYNDTIAEWKEKAQIKIYEDNISNL